jgi:UDP-N-acetylmuramoyl-L-alanyl-D-glutamate--2,6-diaminopimelate ligase
VSAHLPPRPEAVVPLPLTKLAVLADAVIAPAGSPVPGNPGSPPQAGEVLVTGITHDSRQLRPGDLYAALPGSRWHGAEFAAIAASAGAVAVLTDPTGVERAAAAGLPSLVLADPRNALGPVSSRVYGDPTGRLTVIGVTGTSGKTTSSYLIEAGMREAGMVTGLIGTVESRVAGMRVPSERTTPEATELQALFAVMAERAVTGVAMEVSSHALALGRVEGTRYVTAAYTNFGLDHLDFHVDRDDYFRAKARLFDGRAAHHVFNVDDPAVASLAGPDSVTVSRRGVAGSTWRATEVRDEGFEQLFTAHGPEGIVLPVRVRLPGVFNVDNALLALAALHTIGIDPQTAARGISACQGVPGRLERVGDGPVLGVVDYAHKPGAVEAALAALRAAARGGRVICVLGCGGDRDHGKRTLMGRAAAEGADVVVVTDDNPRSEDPAVIRAAVLAGAAGLAGTANPPGGSKLAGAGGGMKLPGGTELIEIGDRAEAIAQAVRLARPGDVVALLGKGHESYQEVGGVTIPFDDRLVLAAALAEVTR